MILGWLDAPRFIAQRTDALTRTAIVGGLATAALAYGPPVPFFVRVPFAIAATAALWASPWSSAAVRFLSETTLAIYLSHYPFQLLVQPWVNAWPPIPRALVLWIASLAAAVALCLAARRILGKERAHFWLGA